jgi:hypothetical protein
VVTGLVAPEVELPELGVVPEPEPVVEPEPELVVEPELTAPLEVPVTLELDVLFLDRAGSWPVASWTNSTAHSRANATSAVAITRLRIDHARRR